MNRRTVLQGGAAIFAGGGALGGSSLASFAAQNVTLPFENGERPLVKYPQKRPMIGLTSRPPQLETPFSVFNDGAITPNDAFFVRYHLAGVPLDIDPDKFTIEVKGKVDQARSNCRWTISARCRRSKSSPSTSVPATAAASSTPRVAGGQLGNGAMGNARWKRRAAQGGAGQGRRAGRAPSRSPSAAWTARSATGRRISPRRSTSTTPRDGEVMLAYAMNGDGSAVPQRLSAAPRGARLLRHLLGQASQRDHRDRHASSTVSG